MKKIYIIVIINILFAIKVIAQTDVAWSNYFQMITAYNPAAAGQYNNIYINAAYSMAMAQFKNKPQTAYIAADMPIKIMQTNNAVGVQLLNDKIGLLSKQQLAVQYAYKINLFGGEIALGLQTAILSEKFDGQHIDTEQPDDPAIIKNQANGTAIDIAAGLFYKTRNLSIGLSAQHINNPNISLDEQHYLKIKTHYYLVALYNIKLKNPFITIKPSLILLTNSAEYKTNITARVVYKNNKKILYTGLGYSPKNSISAYIGGTFHNVMIGYAYEAFTTGINMANGNHELFVAYKMDINTTTKKRNKHKSVRIL